jgi:hypothetical protein
MSPWAHAVLKVIKADGCRRTLNVGTEMIDGLRTLWPPSMS